MNWLTISIPAYNEEKNIIPLIYDIINICDLLAIDYSIFIINDGSTDDTEKKINKNFGNDSRISIYRHERNMGFGQTIKDCFTIPDSEWIMNISGDNQFPAENIRRMIPYCKIHDVILGYRTNRHDNKYRKITSLVYNLLISSLAKKKINDVSSILLVKKSLICDKHFKSISGFIHAEIAIEALKNSSSYTEVELIHRERKYGNASGGKLSTILYTIFEMLKYITGIL